MTDFNKIPDIVIAGDVIYAGIDSDDQSEIPCAVVIQFENKEQMCEAMRSRSINFTYFGNE